METPYRAVSFKTDDIITTDIMDQVQSNLQYVHDNTPRMKYFDGTKWIQSPLVFTCGRVKIGRSKKEDTVKYGVSFGSVFHPMCTPHVTLGIAAEVETEVFAIVNGPGNKMFPSASGFEIRVTAREADSDHKKAKKRWQIAKEFHVFWQAFGYRNNTIGAEI